MTLGRTAFFGFALLSTASILPATTLRETPILTFPPALTRTINLVPTERVPDAQGEVRIAADGTMTGIDVQLDDMRPAALFGGDYNTYVLWAVSAKGEVHNLGEFILEGDRSRLHTSTRLNTFGMIITAEPHFLVSSPSAFVVFEVRPEKAGRIIRYPVFEGVYNFERSRLSNVKKAKGLVQTEVKQAFAAFQLAQRAGANELAKDELIQAEHSLDGIVTLLHRGVSRNEIAALARETVRLAVAAQHLAQDRAFSALDSEGKAREEETAWGDRPAIKEAYRR